MAVRTSVVDLAVVGAGPGGIAAAITAHRGGATVRVYDKAVFPRDKICGDGLTTSALRQLEWLGFDLAASGAVPVGKVTVMGPNGRSVLMELPDGPGIYAAILPRRQLDNQLVETARRAGIEVCDGVEVSEVRHGNGVVNFTAGGQALDAAALIAADGMWSPVRTGLGLTPPSYRGEWHAVRQYVSGVGERAASEIFVSFEPDFLPGYFWSFPLGNGRANIGFGIARGRRYKTADMRWMWPELLRRPGIASWLGTDFTPDEPHRAWPIPARIDELTSAVGRVMFVGDALGACDIVTGEGIGQALVSGRLAAEAMLAHQTPEARAAAYATALEPTLVNDHRMAKFLTRASSHRKGINIAMRLIDSSDWLRRHYVRWLFEDSARGIALTPREWRRGALSGEGAFQHPEGHGRASAEQALSQSA